MLILKYCQLHISARTLQLGGSVARRMGRVAPARLRGMSSHDQLGRISRSFALMLFVFMCSFFSGVGAMTSMSDDQLSEVTGQALMQMGKQAGAGGLTFYKAGLDAEVELNMNIEKLQLGCGGVNGPGCDIDIDRVSLSGGTWGADGRPSAAAILTRPFFEFAIRNDDSKTLREVVGIRLSAENAQGMMTFGDQQAGAGDPGNTSGINSLSGYMKLGATSGNALVEPRPMSSTNYTCQPTDPCEGTYTALGRSMEGRIRITGTVILDGTQDFTADSYQLQVWSDDPAVVTVPSTVVSGKRMTDVNLLGSATMGLLEFAGNMTADIGISLNKNVTGAISGLSATVPIQQSLKFIHKINVNSPFSLSMQNSNVLWPGASVAAETGWWLAIEDEIDIGSISPEDRVKVTNDVLLQALGPTAISWTPNPVPQGQSPSCVQGPSINCALHTAISTATYTQNNVIYHHVYGTECDGLGGCLGDLNVGTLYVPANLNFPLNNLKLSGQTVTPNCYGTARFC